MVRINLVLPEHIVSAMEMFGDVSEVTNKILHLCEIGQIDVYNKPPISKSEYHRKIVVAVNNEYYEDLLLTYGFTSRNISLKRLICWFFETEQYEHFNWTPSNNYSNKRVEKLRAALFVAEGDIMRAVIDVPEYADDIKAICKQMAELRERIL